MVIVISIIGGCCGGFGCLGVGVASVLAGAGVLALASVALIPTMLRPTGGVACAGVKIPTTPLPNLLVFRTRR